MTRCVFHGIGALGLPLFLALPGRAEEAGLCLIQVGIHVLATQPGMAPPASPASAEQRHGPLAGLKYLAKRKGHWSWGGGIEIEGNGLDAGPDLPPAGTQHFGIATVRLLGEVEWRPLPRGEDSWRITEPYLVVGAGWNFNRSGTKIQYPLGGAPADRPVSLRLGGSSALKLGLGIHQRITAQGLRFTFEAGYKANEPKFRMAISQQPDRSGKARLSGAYFLAGIGLLF